jgi:hypothetical protein
MIIGRRKICSPARWAADESGAASDYSTHLSLPLATTNDTSMNGGTTRPEVARWGDKNGRRCPCSASGAQIRVWEPCCRAQSVTFRFLDYSNRVVLLSVRSAMLGILLLFGSISGLIFTLTALPFDFRGGVSVGVESARVAAPSPRTAARSVRIRSRCSSPPTTRNSASARP